MAITSNCAEIIITNPQGSVAFNKLITTTELSPAKTVDSEDRVYLIQNSENAPQTFWWNLEKAIADGYADLQELYDYFVDEIANQCGGGGGGGIESIVAGTNITVDDTDPQNPIISATGGGSPAGSDTQIQYNNAGSFGASSGLTFNQTTNSFTATNDWEIFRSEINFSSNGGSDDLSASSETSFTGTPPTTFAVFAFGNIQIVNYTNLVGGNFSLGYIITGSISGAQGTVAYDDGSGQLYVSITNSIQFASGDVIDNGDGVTADYDTSTTSNDVFFWFSSNGGSDGPTVITGSSQTLNDGISITFGSTTGHGAGDSWDWSYKTLKNTLLTNRIVGTGELSGAINGQYFKSGSGSSIIQSMNGFFQNGNDDRIFPLSYYEDLTGNNSDKERAYYGLIPFKDDPSEPLNFTVYTRKGLGPVPGTPDISIFSVSSLNGIRMVSDKIVYIDSPLFIASEQIFSWIGNTNSTGITIDDVNEQITIGNIKAYDDDAAAGVGGLTAGMVYMTTGSGSAPLNAAGILMIKQ